MESSARVCVCVCGVCGVCGVCVSIYVSMEFEGEERKKGRRGRKGRGTPRTVTVGSSKTICVLYLQRHLAPGSLIFSI